MKVFLSFVPPGGGEQDYSLNVDLPALPREGDYISVFREQPTVEPQERGYETFYVRRVRWFINADSVEFSQVTIECEFADSPTASKQHNDTCRRYAEKTGVPPQVLTESCW